MDAREYIWRQCPGRRPSEGETAAVLEWCDDWARDTFGDGCVAGLSPVQLLRGCDRHIDGGIAFVLADVRWIPEAAV